MKEQCTELLLLESGGCRILSDAKQLTIKFSEKISLDYLPEALERLNAGTAASALLSQVIPILLEQEIADIQDDRIIIAVDQIDLLYEPEYGLEAILPTLCPYWLHIESRGLIGKANFQLIHGYYSGHERVSVERVGPFVKRASSLYFLPRNISTLVQIIDDFNAKSNEQKAVQSETFLTIARIKQLGEGVVSFDRFLSEESVVIAETVAVDVECDKEGRITLFPQIAGISEQDMKEKHMRFAESETVYSFGKSDGSRVRVVPNRSVREAIDLMSKCRRIGGKERDRVLSDPLSFFAKHSSLDVVDISPLEGKIPSLGPYTFRPKVYLRNQSTDFNKQAGPKEEKRLEILAFDSAGVELHVELRNDSVAEELLESITQAKRRDEPFVKLPKATGCDSVVPLTKDLDELTNQLVSPSVAEGSGQLSDRSSGSRVAQTDNNTAYAITRKVHEQEVAELGELIFEPPNCLLTRINRKPFEVHPYQKQGVAWLQNSLRLALHSTERRQGCLLADDMGLGKTLQVLCFLAWCIESELKTQITLDPKKPLLIIAPVILLAVWERELKKFFYANGRIFETYCVLHGDELNQWKTKLADGSKSLDVERIRKQRLIITNYDTVKNYIHAFKEVPWSVVVLDEAQEIKDPNTNIAKCVKQLSGMFTLAMTGTPVENKLLDLWSIMDFAQPNLLGSRRDFESAFQPKNQEKSAIDTSEKAASLREKLHFDTSRTYIVRRTKEGSLQGLPAKKHILRITELSDLQTSLHKGIAREISMSIGKGSHLTHIQRLVKIYQHPALELESSVEQPIEHYLKDCPKLIDLLNVLHEIKRRNEKALIFTRFINMQLIIQRLLDSEFGHFDIINGSRAGEGGSRPELRQSIIDKFEQKKGFNVLILSPDVAGVGLTITGANNVIHYGRWWNPAKEAQANDRVYRLGQQRAVNIYYLVSTSSEFVTFDESLHLLLSRKAKLARDFLVPSADLEVKEQEILQSLLGGLDSSNESSDHLTASVISKLSLGHLEGLTAALWRAMGSTSYLLPAAFSGTAKVLAYKRGRVDLISCVAQMHSSVKDIASELEKSAVLLKEKLNFEPFENAQFKNSLVFNHAISRETKDFLRQCEFGFAEPSDLARMITEVQFTTADIFREEDLRFQSFEEFLRKVRSTS